MIDWMLLLTLVGGVFCLGFLVGRTRKLKGYETLVDDLMAENRKLRMAALRHDGEIRKYEEVMRLDRAGLWMDAADGSYVRFTPGRPPPEGGQ